MTTEIGKFCVHVNVWFLLHSNLIRIVQFSSRNANKHVYGNVSIPWSLRYNKFTHGTTVHKALLSINKNSYFWYGIKSIEHFIACLSEDGEIKSVRIPVLCYLRLYRSLYLSPCVSISLTYFSDGMVGLTRAKPKNPFNLIKQSIIIFLVPNVITCTPNTSRKIYHFVDDCGKRVLFVTNYSYLFSRWCCDLVQGLPSAWDKSGNVPTVLFVRQSHKQTRSLFSFSYFYILCGYNFRCNDNGSC